MTTKPTQGDCCGGCRFFESFELVGDKDTGKCRRYAPQPIMRDCANEDSPTEWSWPWLTSIDWCGEHRPKGEQERPLDIIQAEIIEHNALERAAVIAEKWDDYYKANSDIAAAIRAEIGKGGK